MSLENQTILREFTSRFKKNPLLIIKDLEVEFYKFPNKVTSFSRLFSKGYGETFSVLDDINLSLYEGDVLGVVGVNGAGKSTLLRTIAGLIPIKNGSIEIYGNNLLVSPGLGIRNELSGRDNIILACIFLGHSTKQAHVLSEEIIDFSDLRENIDKPFKYYSDGMKSRLIFSIATGCPRDFNA